MISSTSGSSAPAGYRFPREVAVAVRWYLSYGLSYRDVEELLAERGIEVDHITVYRWVQTFTAQFINAAARPARHAVGDRWFVDETYVKVASRWTYLYRAVDQRGQVIDVLVSTRRNAPAARAFFARALRLGPVPVEVVTDRAPVYPRLLNDLMPRGTSPSGTRRMKCQERRRREWLFVPGIPAHRSRLIAAARSRGRWSARLDGRP
jgi:transposase, IS6 family